MPKERSGLASSAERGPRLRLNDLEDYFENAGQREVDALLQRIQQSDIGERENDNDVQRFFDLVGWADDTPEVLGELEYQQAWFDAGQPTQLYHSDANAGDIDARDFAKQYFGLATTFSGDTIRHYISNGYFGGGTYYADSASDSAWYGSSQFRGFLNSNARVVTWSKLVAEQRAYENSHPAFAAFMSRIRTGYGDEDEARSIFAAMRGYNVIDNEMGYTVVLNRKATTVSRKTKKASTGMANW